MRTAARRLLFAALCLWPVLAQADDYTRTRYPIVLAHGMSGFDRLFGLIEYFHEVPRALRDGGATVFVTEVSQFNDTTVRGEQLLAQVEEIVAITGAGKVNLIGHSHGGLDARYVASVRPDLVASVTTIGTPHQGADLANWLRARVRNGSFTEEVMGFFANQLGFILALLSGTDNPQDAVAALDSLTRAGLEQFNRDHPQGLPARWCGEGPAQVEGVRYYSWTGTHPVTNLLDITDAAFALTSLVYGEPTDGLAGKCSTHLGDVIRDDYRMNHLDEVNL
ncbi:MAG: triacylglycerol lipase, partial [Myxococcales bacterium]|nr:triacylglycerol lipase [Myxococcales bacterium]